MATGRLDVARRILLRWAGTISEGMVPNRFPDTESEPEYNSVDASLWYVIAVHEYLSAAPGRPMPDHVTRDRAVLHDAVETILSGYAEGHAGSASAWTPTAFLAAGEPGTQLTWMDAKVGDRVITPRIGKPVEVQALWLNALNIASSFSGRWMDIRARGLASFSDRFWNDGRGCLYDVVDCDHRAVTVAGAFRPNQILAVGGLPVPLVTGRRARMIVEAAWRISGLPGLRSLAPGEPGYVPFYQGGVSERDSAYHQGTVWPWLAGPFIEAWVRVHGSTQRAKQAARRRFSSPCCNTPMKPGLDTSRRLPMPKRRLRPEAVLSKHGRLERFAPVESGVGGRAAHRGAAGASGQHGRGDASWTWNDPIEKKRRMRVPNEPLAEVRRVEENARRIKRWNRWGPFLSERAWGTVREDYSPYGTAWEFLPHDHARSKAYRWNEDGLAGICDRHQYICFAVALWNGRDPLLKERLFGLTGNEGNHGEDVKEYYFYLDCTPTHSYMKYLYKYPQGEFPYRRLVEENRRRSRRDLEFELIDTGVFDQNRYWDVFVEYAKESPEELLIRIQAVNRGPNRPS